MLPELDVHRGSYKLAQAVLMHQAEVPQRLAKLDTHLGFAAAMGRPTCAQLDALSSRQLDSPQAVLCGCNALARYRRDTHRHIVPAYLNCLSSRTDTIRQGAHLAAEA